MKKAVVILRYIGDDTSQLCGDYDKPLQPVQWKARVFFFRGSLGLAKKKNKLQDTLHPLHQSLMHGPFLPFHFRLKGFQAGCKSFLLRGHAWISMEVSN